MAKLHPEIDPEMAAWIAAQPLFFVASAPLAANGHVNCSPRGLDTFRVLGPHHVAWLDLTGSGNETAAHLAENGRITLMFCAFAGRPRILRLFGRGEVALPGSAEFATLRGHFPADLPGVRQIIRVVVSRIQTSCGFGVPLMTFAAQRDDLAAWAERKGGDGLVRYRRERNARSIDGLAAPLGDDH
ncbi:MAG: pyridoxamine 5'-phosphate oxidase family protein [Gammaproteobacteria bacterium]|nr:pyridoxamine 5'-phosphate oxidase family protein [Gammaproteobacteria bacterium]